VGAAQAVAHRGEDEVFEHLDVIGVDDFGCDVHRLHVTRAGDDDLDHAATGRALDGGLGERVLRRGHVGLHLLHLLHHLVELAPAATSPRHRRSATFALRHRALRRL
jgi:hypothetical protein